MVKAPQMRNYRIPPKGRSFSRRNLSRFPLSPPLQRAANQVSARRAKRRFIPDPYTNQVLYLNDPRLHGPRPEYHEAELARIDATRLADLSLNQGPKMAIFDIDNTLVLNNLGWIYYEFMKAVGVGKTMTIARRFLTRPHRLLWNTFSYYRGRNFLTPIALGAQFLIGEKEKDVWGLTHKFMEKVVLNPQFYEIAPFIFDKARQKIQEYRDGGYLIMFASATSYYPARLLGDKLGADFVLGVRTKVRKEKITGDLDGSVTAGAGKAEQIGFFVDQFKIPPGHTIFLSDDIEFDAWCFDRFGGQDQKWATNIPWRLVPQARRLGYHLIRFDGQKGPEDAPSEQRRLEIINSQKAFSREQGRLA